MKFFIFLGFFLVCLQGFPQADTGALKEQIQIIFTSTRGDFAMAFQNLSKEDELLLINEKEGFHAASTMKTPVMIEVFKQAEQGKFSLEDSLTVKNEFQSIKDGSMFSLELGRDSGEHLYEQIGQKRSIRDLVTDMVIYSSNLATNIVIELVDAENVNQTMRELGAMDIQVLRGVEDMKAYKAGLNNTTTAYDLMLIFEKLAEGKAVNPQADREMLEILRAQKHTDLIPALLPENVKIANKTGWITGVRHDSAYLELPDGKRYVLVLLSKNVKEKEMDAATEMLTKVSKLIYDFVAKRH